MTPFTDDDSIKRPASFSDADLKRLKDWLSGTDTRSDEVWLMRMRKTELYLALLARLEAAEALIEYAKYYEPVSISDEKEWRYKTRAWRKSKGEEAGK